MGVVLFKGRCPKKHNKLRDEALALVNKYLPKLGLDDWFVTLSIVEDDGIDMSCEITIDCEVIHIDVSVNRAEPADLEFGLVHELSHSLVHDLNVFTGDLIATAYSEQAVIDFACSVKEHIIEKCVNSITECILGRKRGVFDKVVIDDDEHSHVWCTERRTEGRAL